MHLYPKNPVGPIPIGIIVFLGFFMIDPGTIFSKAGVNTALQQTEFEVISESSGTLPYPSIEPDIF